MLMDVVFLDMAWVERRLGGDELAVCSLITSPSADSFVDVLQQSSSFTTDHDVEAFLVAESIGTSLKVSRYIGTQLPQERIAHSFRFPFAVHVPDWKHIIMNTLRNACEAVECWPGFLANWLHWHGLPSQAFLTHSATRSPRVWMRHAKTWAMGVHPGSCSVHAAGRTSQTVERSTQLPRGGVVAWRESRVRQHGHAVTQVLWTKQLLSLMDRLLG